MHTPSCEVCGGTGWQWLLRTMFTTDGYYRERCGICAGTGKSAYRGVDRKFVNRQATLRFTASFRARTADGKASAPEASAEARSAVANT